MKRGIAQVGHGAYRLLAGMPAHSAALSDSVKSGLVSLIDTSPNYGDGQSEALVGNVLSSVESSSVRVCSKFGFIEGSNLELHKQNPFPEACEFTDSCSHSIHPDFMKHQLEASLSRLGRIDLYLLHNPEHFLMAQIPPDTDPLASESGNLLLQNARESLMKRIRTTFVALEEQVKLGRIGSYGISSNSFSFPLSHPHYVQYEQLISLAEAAAVEVHGEQLDENGNQKHTFKAIQLPGNLLEREGLTPVSAGGNGCAEWAIKNGLEVIVNRPLSAFDEQGTWRFAEMDFPVGYSVAKDALIERLSPDLPDPASCSEEEKEDIEATIEACNWFKQLINDLDAQITAFSSILHYNHDFNTKIIPLIMDKLEGMDEETSNMVHTFFVEYEKAVRSVTGQLARNNLIDVLQNKTKNTNPLISQEEFERHIPQITTADDKLEDFALKWLLQHPHVSTVLIGMGNPAQVDHVKQLVKSIQ